MNEIADFLRARYAEVRHVALKASGAPWTADVPNTVHVDARAIAESRGLRQRGYVASAADADYQEHIVRHDPAAVLADLDAKLAIVDLMDRTLDAAQGDSEVDHYGGLGAAEETLCRLAQPFAGHPDHKGEEWAP